MFVLNVSVLVLSYWCASVDSSTRSFSGASSRIGPSSAAAAVVTSRAVATLPSDVDDASLCDSGDLVSSSGVVVSLSSSVSFDSESDILISTGPIDPSSSGGIKLYLYSFVSVFALIRVSLSLTILPSVCPGTLQSLDRDLIDGHTVISGSSSGVHSIVRSGRVDVRSSPTDFSSDLSSGIASRTRSNRSIAPTVHSPLGSIGVDSSLAIVYLDLHELLPVVDTDLVKLQDRLRMVRPRSRDLERMQVNNRERILFTVKDDLVVRLCCKWIQRIWSTVPEFWTMLGPLGSRVLLLGIQFIVPKVSEYFPHIRAQVPHADVLERGLVYGLAMHLDGGPLGTLISLDRTIHSCSDDLANVTDEFKSADTPLFVYDTGVVHAGPGSSKFPAPYPHFVTNRVFFVFCSADLNPTRLDQFYEDNGLTEDLKTVLHRPAKPEPADSRTCA